MIPLARRVVVKRRINTAMRNNTSTLSASHRQSLFEACSGEAKRLGGNERTAEYFFGRAQSSRVWLSEQGDVTIADMDIADWCSAIAWSAPGIRRPAKGVEAAPSAADTTQSAIADATEPTNTPEDTSPLDATNPGARTATTEIKRKQPRSGARAKENQA